MNEQNVRHIRSGPLEYLLSVPPENAEGRLVPVLCFLHGYDEGAPVPVEEGVTRHGPLRDGSSPVATDRFIVVAPQMPTRGDVWLRYAEEVRRIVSDVQARHGGDPSRTYLTGFSFGGNGVLDLAIAQPDLWAGLWPVDPTRVPEEGPTRPIWLSFGEVARYRQRSFIESLGLEPADDGVSGDRLYTDRGESHVASATTAYQEERIYAWLLERTRPER